jgi:hypothetical protein
LGQNPADIDIYKVKILCCINLQKFDDALEIADFNGEFAFEKAYCLYRKNRVSASHLEPRSTSSDFISQLTEAVNVCNSVKSKSDEILHLQGQAVDLPLLIRLLLTFPHLFSPALQTPKI